tara:strand:- start:399 stop:722 length:324 start_codon:yes stop_codon:yes gene_type:complete
MFLISVSILVVEFMFIECVNNDSVCAHLGFVLSNSLQMMSMQMIQPIVTMKYNVTRKPNRKRIITTVKIPNDEGTYRLRYVYPLVLLNVIFIGIVVVLACFIKDDKE